jgi:hypothetical protein
MTETALNTEVRSWEFGVGSKKKKKTPNPELITPNCFLRPKEETTFKWEEKNWA